jgi:release factor glutamine methyltransferase
MPAYGQRKGASHKKFIAVVIVGFHAYTCKDCEAPMNSKTLFDDLVRKLTAPSDAGEREAIVFRILENVTGITRVDTLAQRNVQVPASVLEKLDQIIARLNQREPVQYVLEEAYFYGRSFYVSNAVLIPRPETEELVDVALRVIRKHSLQSAIDIGTGSGCIPITLKLEIPTLRVSATDVSDAALEVARRNAMQLHADVQFLHHDILQDALTPAYDLIISNPPYIAIEEGHTLDANVLAYEPHLALFSPGDPLLFYRHLAAQAKQALQPGGFLVVEINERFGSEVKEIFQQYSLQEIEIIRDISWKDRIVKATK